MSDEQIVVGAKDEATRILDSVSQSVDRMEQAIVKSADSTESSSSRIEFSFNSLAIAATALAAAYTVVSVASSAMAASDRNVAAFVSQEASIRGLTHALELQTDEVESSLAARKEFAAQLAEFGNIGDEVTFSLQRQAAQMGFQGDQIDALIATAAGLKGEFGIELTQAFDLAAAAAHGNSSALQGLIPEMRFAFTEAQRFEMVTRAATHGLDALSETTTTVEGKMQRSANAWGDLYESLGAIVAPLYGVAADAAFEFANTLALELAPAAEWVNTTVENSQPVLDAFFLAMHNGSVIAGVAIDATLSVFDVLLDSIGINADAAESWGETFSGVVQWASENIIAGITWIEVIFSNLPQGIEYAMLAVEASFIGFVEDAKHTFTVAVPAYIAWFTGSSSTTLQAYAEFTWGMAETVTDALLAPWRTVLDYLPQVTSELADTMEAVNGALASQLKVASMQMAAMPDIAERQMTSRELEIQQRMGEIGADLAGEFQEKFDERVARLGLTARQNFEQDLKADIAGLERQLPRIGIDTSQLTAVEARFLSRGTTNDPLFGIEAHTRRTADHLAKLPDDLAAALERHAQRSPTETIGVIE